MKRLALAVVLTTCMAGITQGAYMFFDFEGLWLTTSDDTIGAYLSGVYGSDVLVDDFEVTDNTALFFDEWVGNDSQFIRHADDPKHYSSDLGIFFKDNPIRALSGDTRAYLFWESGGVDLWVKAVGAGWDRDGATLESPNYLAADYFVERAVRAEIGPDGSELNIPELIFEEPVFVLTFRGHAPGQVAIDHLGVEPWGAITKHTLTISSTSGGSVATPGEGSFEYASGAVVPVIATEDIGYEFGGWTGTAADAGKVADPSLASTTVTVDADYTLEANFTAVVDRTLTISSTTGGSVTTPGEGPFEYEDGTIVSVSATADAGYQFEVWTGTAVAAGKIADPSLASTTVTVDADYTLEANFTAVVIGRTLTISSTIGGSVTTPGEGPFEYEDGAIVSVSATATPGYQFEVWTGTAVDAGKVADTSLPSTTVTVDADYTLEANFAFIDGDYTFFDFEGIDPTASDSAIGAYLSGVYGSDVVVDDFEVTDNVLLFFEGWTWKGNDSQFIRHYDDPKHRSSDLAIFFKDNPIRALSGDTRAYLFWESGGVDLWVKAVGAGWDRDGGTLESPNYLAADYFVEKPIRAEIGPDGCELDIPEMTFDEPVYVLTFRGHRRHQVAIDHLGVEPWGPLD
ncbi:MAG: hypothetical protein JSU70_22940 [Phycisphaerales bacterium]|nr:MAG: hypothetical protein JSU70_22940 [Phycisphaerales bacterium]